MYSNETFFIYIEALRLSLHITNIVNHTILICNGVGVSLGKRSWVFYLELNLV